MLLQKGVRLAWLEPINSGLPNSISSTELTKSPQSSRTVFGHFCRDRLVTKAESFWGLSRERERNENRDQDTLVWALAAL